MSNENCIRKEPWNILCRVISQEGTCALGHKVGDEILFTHDEVKGKICFSLLYSVVPKVYAMMYNSYFPWVKDHCKATHACPDAYNPVVVELERTERTS